MCIIVVASARRTSSGASRNAHRQLKTISVVGIYYAVYLIVRTYTYLYPPVCVIMSPFNNNMDAGERSERRDNRVGGDDGGGFD